MLHRHTRTRAAALALAVPTLLSAGACASGKSGDLLGPQEVVQATTNGGTRVTTTAVGVGALIGRWTRLESASTGSSLEITFAFGTDGSGSRTTVVRTALGGVISADVQPFTWSGGGGVLLLRLAQPGTVQVQTLSATYRVEQGLTGTVLVLDGQTYLRAS